MTHDMLMYLREMFRGEPICSLMPTSSFTVRQVCREIPTDRPVCIAEYGPGSGVFTRYLVNRVHPHSMIVAIEVNRALHDELVMWRATTRPRCRLILVHDTCENVLKIQSRHDIPPFDFVLSGVPFSILSKFDQEQLLSRTHQALGVGGIGLFYQTTMALRKPLARLFDSVQAEHSFLNIPPLAIMRARKSNFSDI